MTSPNATASAVVPARAVGPAAATRSFNSSGCREENITGWPSLANSVPSAPPSRPAPMVAILIEDGAVAWAKAPLGAAMEVRTSPPARMSMKVRRLAQKGEAFVITYSMARSKQKRGKVRQMGARDATGAGHRILDGIKRGGSSMKARQFLLALLPWMCPPGAMAQTALPPPHFHHLALNSTDPEGAASFYRKQFT